MVDFRQKLHQLLLLLVVASVFVASDDDLSDEVQEDSNSRSGRFFNVIRSPVNRQYVNPNYQVGYSVT